MAEKEAGKAKTVMNISIDIFLYKRDTDLPLFVIAQNTSLARSPKTHSESSVGSKAGFLMYCTAIISEAGNHVQAIIEVAAQCKAKTLIRYRHGCTTG